MNDLLRNKGFPVYEAFSKLHWPSKVSKNIGFPVKLDAVSDFFKPSKSFNETTLWSMQKVDETL